MRRSETWATLGVRRLAGVGAVAAVLVATSAAAAAAAPAPDAWHKDGPGGAQYIDGYGLTRVFADKGAWYSSFTPEPGDRSFLAIETITDSNRPETWKTRAVRLTPGANGRLHTEQVLAFERLRDPNLWSDGVDAGEASIGRGPGNGGASPISVAPGGDMLIAASATVDGSNADQTLVRLSPDGSLQKVVSSADMVAADVFGTAVVVPWVVAAAVTDDRLYGRAEGWDGASDQLVRLVQIIDPDGDGDWSDRQIRPIVLPDSIPRVEDGVYDWTYGGFVPLPADAEAADPAVPTSVLLPLIGKDEYRVYRLTDLGDDGVFTEPDETELVFSTKLDPGSLDPWSPPKLALAPSAPGVTNLVLAGLTDPSRVSVVAEDGVAEDIVRSLFSPVGLVVLADGSILIGNQGESPRGPARQPYSILRLVGGAPSTGTSSEPSKATTLPTPGRKIIHRASLTPGIPRISAWVWASAKGSDAEMLLLYGADGSGPRDALPGVQEPWSGPCQSADASVAAAWAEVDVPNEEALYLFDTSGQAPPAMITERSGTIYCPFPPGALALASEGDSESRSVSRIDLEDGFTAAPLVQIRQGLCAAVTDDGRYLAVASGDGTDLSLIDVVDGSVQPLAEGLDGTVVRSAWTPDGSRLAFVTGPYDAMQVESSVTGTFEISVMDVAAGTPPQQIFSVEGPAPDVTWSPDSRMLAVLGRETETPYCCERAGTLTIVDTLTGDTRTVAPDATYAEWSPVDPAVFAWGDATTLSIEIDGVVHTVEPPVVKADKGRKPASWSGFMGWSPDGRYLGFGYPRLMTVDTTDGSSTVILDESDDLGLISTEWWQ